MSHVAWPRSAAVRAPAPAEAMADPCFHRRHLNTQKQVWNSLCGVSGSWCSQDLVWALRASLADTGFDSKHGFTPLTILLGCLLCPWIWGIFFWWDRTFSCQWLFDSEVQFWSSHRRWVHVLLLCHLGVPRRHLLLGRKAMTNLDCILKSKEITLLTKVHLDKAIVFPVVMYGCESWTIKKAKCRRIDAFELWCWKRLLRVP